MFRLNSSFVQMIMNVKDYNAREDVQLHASALIIFDFLHSEHFSV